MCLRKISTSVIALLILILLIPAIFDVGALADPGKPVHKKAVTVQPGEEVVVTDIVSGPSPQEAEATGLDAAGGKDRVLNDGTVWAEAAASTTASLRGAVAGAQSIGINGSGGKDSILNNGALSSKATSTVTSLSLSVNIDGFTLPFMRKFPPVTGGSLAESFAAGILGGNGNDIVEHSGVMTVEATSTAAAGSINVNLTGKNEKVLSKAIPAIWAVKPPVMKADAPGKAASEAVGIDGGRGDDRVVSTGAMTVKASATSGAGSLNLNLGNDARVNLSAEATATASGIRAVEGKDEVVNQGALTVEASATAGAGAVSVSYPTDRGIYGMPEKPTAKSRVQIPIFGMQGDLSGKATASATGIESGAADMTIVNSGPIVSKASATAAAGSIAAGVGDSVEGSVAALSGAESRGIRSGDGSDVVLNSGEQTVEAKAIAGAGSLSVGVRNPEQTADPSKAKADASGTAESLAVGIETGSGDDLVASTAAMSVKASSTAGAGSVAVGIGGGADSNVSAEAIARAAGIRGGDGNDSIR
ncbi:MAG TPA: hypothetical protein VLA94_00055, partial [Syntrophales bacterium]|nr:hypothetical protein [Syntrophales bacterium]